MSGPRYQQGRHTPRTSGASCFPAFPRNERMLIRAVSATFVAILALVPVAGAVDVENASKTEQTVLLTEPGGKSNVVLKAGETKLDVCAKGTVNVEGMEPLDGVGLARTEGRRGGKGVWRN